MNALEDNNRKVIRIMSDYPQSLMRISIRTGLDQRDALLALRRLHNRRLVSRDKGWVLTKNGKRVAHLL